MFVRDAIQVECPFEVVAPRFLRHPAWLEPLISVAVGQHAARCQRGTARRRVDSLVVPMRWVVDDMHAFSSLDGDLVIEPAGATSSQLTFEATYSLSDKDEETAPTTQRAVEAAVGAFLEGLAGALQLEAPLPLRPLP
jgi:hypothetical protein